MFWPGVLIHELSHFVGAVITFTKIRGISLWPHDQGNSRVFGSVEFEGTKNPIKLVAISMLPLFVGSFLLYLGMGYFHIHAGLPLPNVFAYTDYAIFIAKESIAAFAPDQLLDWIVLYLLIAVAVHLAPSTQDLKYTTMGGFILAVAVMSLVAIATRLNFSLPSFSHAITIGEKSLLSWLIPATGVMIALTGIALPLAALKMIFVRLFR